MQLFIYVDESEIEPEVRAQRLAPVAAALAAWSEEQGADYVPVDEPHEPRLGLHMHVKRKGELKAPLAFLYGLAREHKLEWALGVIDEQSGEREEVCYFGLEEGRPDAFEVGNYVGL
ncbi:hypothetical protein [Motiliproteus sp. SC1-56]|uniref:hypothetical protein n=1 Tax=Motiliproteus sp. SC1-56 TaxID=2799565 RepID=UPI001A8F349E|nr:hypothetical protein [Motiliproteus sp. SC1-56]